MPNLLRRSLDLHTRRLLGSAGDPIVYRRGSAILELTAVPGESLWDEVDSEGTATLKVNSIDFIVDASKFVLGGKRAEPTQGDTIETHDGDVYDVLPGSAPSSGKYNSGQKTLLRIHTVRREFNEETT